MWPDFCAGRGFNHVRFDKMHDYVVNLDKGERIVLAYTKPYILFTKSAYKRVGRDDYPFERHDFDRIMNERLAASVGMRHMVGSPLADGV